VTRYNEVTKVLPPVGVQVIVWWWVGEKLATWDGAQWRAEDGAPLHGVQYWREVQP
jgi:hypothetical protein